jgi:ribosomal protein S18 acetylase RimI-like enzyme
LLNDEPVGRLYLHRRQDEIRIIDIALLTEHRGKGIGSLLMLDILEEATQAALPVRIHVERNNPALRLYQRLGFRAIADQGVYWLMEWHPDRTNG